MFIEDSPGLPLVSEGEDSSVPKETAECPPTPEDVSSCMPDSPVAVQHENDAQITPVNDMEPEQGGENIDERCVLIIAGMLTRGQGQPIWRKVIPISE